MIFIALLMVVVVAFDLAALRWGVDTRDRLESSEWERRRQWKLSL